MQRTESGVAIYVVCVYHLRSRCKLRFASLAVADLASRQMTREPRRWKIVVVAVAAFLVVLVSGAVIANSWYRATERTYYGPHSDLLRVGERVTLSQDFSATGHVVAKAQSAVVEEEPAWDEDSCDPDRPIKIALASGESISVPRHLLHR